MGLSYHRVTVISLFFVLSSCTIISPEGKPSCDKGHTRLGGGTCVAQEIANYVGCIEARAAKFSSEKNRMLAAEIGTMGAKASGAADLSQKLYKTFDSSDKVAMKILEHCNEKTSTKKKVALLLTTPVNSCPDTNEQMKYKKEEEPLAQTRIIELHKKHKGIGKKDVCPLC